MTTRIDPFLLEILRNAFDTVADDIAITLMRTALSPIVRDSLDFSTALCGRDGRVLAQGVCTPMHLGSFHDAMDLLVGLHAGTCRPGDVFVMNDPYVASGQHLPDIYVVMPVFVDGRVAGWSTTLAHHSDVGGIVAGSNALGAHEVFQEGLRIPLLKLVDAGEPNETLWRIIETNVRTPHWVKGDLSAQIAACETGARGLADLHARYGSAVIDAAAEALHDYAEALARAEIAKIPDGEYRFTDHIDGLGPDPEPIVFACRVTVSGETVEVDWTGSSAEVKGGVNSTFPFTKACVYAAIRSVMTADVPNCHGFTRPITVRAPLGTVMNPRPPAPCGARGITGYRMIDCLFGALAEAVPDRVTADGSGGSTLPTIAGYDAAGRYFVFCETAMGTWGAAADHDGQEGVPHIGANQSNIPIELIEERFPLRIERYALVPDTGGAGRHRGGLAIERSYRLLAPEADLAVRSDKRRHRPHGLFGGRDGTPSMNVIERADGTREELPVLPLAPVPMRRGDVFRHVMASGGGYGNLAERDPQAIRDDLADGRITPAEARRTYGFED